MKPHSMKLSPQPVASAHATEENPAAARMIGDLLRAICALDEDQIGRIVAYQRQSGLRFGEAAVALRLAARNDVLAALSRQFEYPVGFVGRELDPELVVAADPFSDQADAFRELRSRLLELPDNAARRVLAVVSPEIGDGKTYLAANVAVAFSQLAERTLLIDADVRTPRQHRLLRVENGAGVSSTLAGFADAAHSVRPVPGLPNLYLLPAGAVPPNPLELLQRRALGVLVQEMMQKFEHVVLDTPAAVRGADARVIAAQCGSALVVARRGRSRMGALEGLLDALGRTRVKVAGLVMNEH
jgi:protein-tyrosine kinase